MSLKMQLAVGVLAAGILVASAVGTFVGLLKLEDRSQSRNRAWVNQ